MDNSPGRILKKVFGYDDFLENQQEIIEAVLNGKDVFVLMPTGGGKSLCYQIPAMLDHGVAIVISPLIALMEDQVKGLQQYGVRAAYLNSSLSFQEAQNVQRRAADGRLDLLYVAPEKLLTENFQHFLAHIRPTLFAIDEAHCVSQWGHDFRPEYLRINEVTRRFADTPRMALTATADAITRKDILEKLDLRQAATFIASLDRPNIRYRVQPKQGEKRQLLAFIRDEHPRGSGIVYVRTRKRTETIASWLAQKGMAALPYHAGLSAEERFGNQRRFQEEDTLIIVATIAFGMGIDKPDVRFVAHLNLPASMEAYYQETGRAGRDGKPADAWMLYSFADVSALRRLFELSEGSEEFKHIRRKKLDALLGYCESAVCRRKLLLNYFGENHGGRCGTCDNCLNPAEVWDGTVAAQKALSCVYRTGQRFGVRHLANVLTGKQTGKIQKWGHDRIKTFGVGRELDVKTWESVYRQLLSAGLLSVKPGKISGVRLTDDSWPVLRGKRTVFFRKDLVPPKIVKGGSPPELVDNGPENEESQPLFEALRNLRLDIARQLKVPPYVVFPDKALREMARVRPTTVEEFSRIAGVGAVKTRRYSGVFLACIHGEKIDLARYMDVIQETGQEAVVKDNGHEAASMDGNLSSETRSFIKNKVLELGTISKVNAYYDSDSAICKYARRIAKKLLPVSPSDNTEGYTKTVRAKHDEPAPAETRGRGDGETPSMGWEPDEPTRQFVINEIRKLGSLSAVRAFYNADSLICQYARYIASKILAESSPESKTSKSYFEKVRKTHDSAYAAWTTEEENQLKQELLSGRSVREIAEKLGRTRGAITARIKKIDLQPSPDHKPEPLTWDSRHKTMVCFAVSKKYNGYCVAGIEMASDGGPSWVRPVSPMRFGELPLEYIKLKGGKIPSVLDVITLSVKKHLPHYYQRENYLIDRSKPWKRVSRTGTEKLAELCDTVDVLWVNGHHSANGKNDRIPIEVANEKCESSLLLIKPQTFSLLLISGLTFKQKMRAEFVYEGITYNFAVTDISVKNEYQNRPDGRYDIKSEHLCLCISLGEPVDGFCYKLVAGVAGLQG